MNLEFYNINDRKRQNLLLSVDELFFEKNNDLLKTFGIDVDIYGTTILPNDKIKFLNDLLEKEGFKTDALKKLYKEGTTLIIEGN